MTRQLEGVKPGDKLSKAQRELLDAMQSGVKVHFVSGLNAHYFRTDWKPIRSTTVDALVSSGAVEEKTDGLGNRDIKLKERADAE